MQIISIHEVDVGFYETFIARFTCQMCRKFHFQKKDLEAQASKPFKLKTYFTGIQISE